MFSSQQMVIKWVEYAAAGAILLLIAKLAASRLRQPADRINLILTSFVAASVVPFLVCLPNVTAWHLGLVASPQSELVASTPVSTQQSMFMELGTSVIQDNLELDRDMIEAPVADTPSVTPAEISARAALSPAVSVAKEMPARRVDSWSVAAAVLLLVHCGAITALFAEWLIGMRCLRGISSRSLPASQAVRSLWMSITQGRGESIRTLVSTEVRTPLAYGCLRTTVIIPHSMTAGESSALRFCLAHEWSHIVRQDLLAWRLTWLCQFVLWFQPLFWILRRELRVCQDFLADHLAANAGADALEYSELLMAFTRQQTGRPIAGAIAFFDRSSQLSRRINMLLNSHVVLRSRSSFRFCVFAIAVTLMCAGLISLVRLDSVQADDTPPPETAPKAEEPKSEQQPAVPKAGKPETLRYTAVVVDEETGKGIPNATVVVRRCTRGSQEYTIIQETRHKTDAEGKYSFEIPPEQVSIDNLYIELDVEHDDYTARKGFGYALGMIRKNEQLGERPFFEKIELWPSDPIAGTVLSPEGKPIAGVKVLGYAKRSPDVAGDYGLLIDTVTDQAGKFRLSLVKGGVGILWVVPVDFSSTSRDVNKQHGDIGEIRLRPGVRASGRVLSAEGKPVSNVPVNIQYLRGGSEAVNKIQLSTLICRSALTDQDGNFAFDPLPNGEYQLMPETYRNDPLKTHLKLYEIPGVFFPAKVQIEEGYVFPPIDIQASPHITFNAQFIDSKGGKTGGHLVMISGRMDGESWFGQARPSSEGTIVFRMPRGLQDVKVELNTNEHSALRYRRGKGKELESNQLQIELRTLDEDVEGFEIIRYQAPIVLVNAVDAEQKQVKGFRVSAVYPWSKQGYYVRGGGMRSDLNFNRQDDGRYRTQKMLPDEDVKFTVAADGYETAIKTVRLTEGETKDLVVTLKKAVESKH